MGSTFERNIFWVFVTALILAALYRLYPLVSGPDVLAQAFMTEDGYLMLTIARNMAIGLGMSVSDGTIPSNGVQPMATFIYAVPYALTGGDKVAGLWGVQLIGAVIAVIGIFTVRALARVFLTPQDPSPLWPWLVTTMWFVSPLLLLHTMNGLETGLYTVMVTLALVVFARLLQKGAEASLQDRLLLGAVCGVAFLARNDAVFLISAIGFVWLFHAFAVLRKPVGQVIGEVILPLALLVLIALPWLVNNYVNFGSIVPVSGTAQSLSGGLGKNANILPAVLFEYVFPMLPVPVRLQYNPAFMIVASAAVCVIVAAFAVQVWRRGGVVRYILVTYLTFALLMCLYYGFYFGAGWFLSRYLSPIAPLLITATLSVALSIFKLMTPARATAIVSVFGVLSLLLCAALLGRYLIPGTKEQGHFQVVDWVNENVPEETWVGAIQTGTVGYWHDRTINLDGKVNPEALNALLTEGNVLNYVLDSEIVYLADWKDVALWTTTGNQGNTDFSNAFEVLVHDIPNNLAVLKRR